MPSDGMPNVLLALYRYLRAEGATPQPKLLDVCAPAVVCQQDRAAHSLNTWAKLGLFAEDGAGRACLTPDAPREESRLRAALRALVFRGDNNEPFWGSKGVRASDFTRGLAWCLAMDPIRLHGQGYKAVNELELDTLPGDVEVFRNDTRWNAFKTWALFLGFAWQSRYPKKYTLVVDPAPAIRDALPAVFGSANDLTHRDFLDRLREQLPVLDGGTYRLAVEEKLLAGRWLRPNAGELSASLSLSLQRLKFEGVIAFENFADPAAGRVTLTGRNGRPTDPVSHVIFKGVQT